MFEPQSRLPDVGTTIFTVITQRARELGAINVSQGFPDFEPPELLRELLRQAAGADVHQYAPMGGIDALREQIGLAARELGFAVDTASEVTVTLGATEALFSSIQALVHPGDEVILFDPCYDAYGPAVRLCAARPIHIPLQAPTFGIDWQRVHDAITPRTRMILLNSPHNPTGAVLQAADLEQLARCIRGTRIVVLSDEVYANMIYDGRQHYSMQTHPELRERSISVFSFGKVLHATGWRVGYAIASPTLTRELRKVHQFNTFSIAQPLQWAIAQFLKAAPDHRAGLKAFYQAKRDYVIGLLQGSRFALTPSPGTFFQLLDYSAISTDTDTKFVERLLCEHGVATIPLSPFCVQPPDYRYVRLCFAKRESTLQQAAERLCKI